VLQSVNSHLYGISQACAVNIMKLCELERVLSVFIAQQKKKTWGGGGYVQDCK
jgi:hypothetical protein